MSIIGGSVGVDDAIGGVNSTKYGDHHILVYPDIESIREIYVAFAKAQLANNAIVVIFPHYEKTDDVRDALYEAGIDVRECEKNCSLVIVDSVKAYFFSEMDVRSMLKQFVAAAEKEGKEGVALFDDMGPFFLYGKQNELIDYEIEIHLDRDISLKVKAICVYHQDDFFTLPEQQQKELLEHHHAHQIVHCQ